MATHKTPQSQKLLKLIESAPFSPEEKSNWSSVLQETGITPELADEVHLAITALPTEKFDNDWEKAKLTMDFTALLKQWRMVEASKNFRHNR